MGSPFGHPALRCAITGCDDPVVAFSETPRQPTGRTTLAVFRSIRHSRTPGLPVCLEHAHHVLDVMLLRATEPPAELGEGRPS